MSVQLSLPFVICSEVRLIYLTLLKLLAQPLHDSDELSRSARGARDSPPLTLARLRVSDEPEDIRPPTSGCSSSSLCGSSKEAGSKVSNCKVFPDLFMNIP